MRNSKIIAALGCLLIVSPCMAGQSEQHNPVLRNASKESAVEFAEKYYAHLNRGMSRKQLRYYWSDDKVAEFDALIFSMAEITGKEPVLESQRLTDLAHMESRCEELELTKAKTYGAQPRKAKLIYAVSYTCTEERAPSERTMTLRFSTDDKHWFIDKIENEAGSR